MDKFTPDSGSRAAREQGTPAAAQPGGGSALYTNYCPSIAQLFAVPDSPALAQMRARLEEIKQALERVVRQGARDEAERAARAARACQTVLGLFDDLQQLQRQMNESGGEK